MITGKRNKYKLLLINNKIYSKSSELNKSLLDEFLEYRKSIEDSKRSEYKFVCECCGKEYTIKLRLDQYEKRKDTRHFCFDCTKSGVMFKGIKFTEEHRLRISEAKSKKEN